MISSPTERNSGRRRKTMAAMPGSGTATVKLPR
jgi:hypothetical protein